MARSSQEVSADHPTSAAEAPVGEVAPLVGIRVLDFTQVIAGPFCTTMLADLGAEVLKVERPGVGDDLRQVGRYAGREDHQDYFYANNRSKKSICLDLKDPDHQRVCHQLAAQADVVVENFAPGTMDRLSMGWQELHAVNQRLLYCSISGFGQTGPSRDRLAIDPIIQSISGVMSVSGSPDGEPMQAGAPLADVIAGMFAAYSIVGALHTVKRDGKGRYIDISMQAAMVAALGPRMGETLQAGTVPERIGNENPMRVPANVYGTRDGGHLNISVSNDRHWPALCRALDRCEWLEDSRFDSSIDRVRHRAELNKMVAERFMDRPAAEWIPLLAAERVPYATVNNYQEALEDPQIAHRGLVHALEHPKSGPIRVVGPPWDISDMPTRMEAPPVLGQHTPDVLAAWLNWSPGEIDQFLDKSVSIHAGKGSS